jgi:hypothetical protein
MIFNILPQCSSFLSIVWLLKAIFPFYSAFPTFFKASVISTDLQIVYAIFLVENTENQLLKQNQYSLPNTSRYLNPKQVFISNKSSPFTVWYILHERRNLQLH